MRLQEKYFAAVVSGNIRDMLPAVYSVWDKLHTLYAAPASIQKLVDDFNLVYNWPGCSI